MKDYRALVESEASAEEVVNEAKETPLVAKKYSREYKIEFIASKVGNGFLTNSKNLKRILTPEGINFFFRKLLDKENPVEFKNNKNKAKQ